MIYLFLENKGNDVELANKWCREQFHDQGDTFVENFKNDNSGKKYCMASIPDNKKAFAMAIAKQFGCFKKDPRGNDQFKPRDEGDTVMKAKFGVLEKLKLTACSVDKPKAEKGPDIT